MLSLMQSENILCICQHGWFMHILITEHFKHKPYLQLSPPWGNLTPPSRGWHVRLSGTQPHVALAHHCWNSRDTCSPYAKGYWQNIICQEQKQHLSGQVAFWYTGKYIFPHFSSFATDKKRACCPNRREGTVWVLHCPEMKIQLASLILVLLALTVPC